MLEHVVLVGLNFQPLRSTGDKNFWVSLIPLIALNLKRITVISLRNHHTSEEEFKLGKCTLHIKYIRPKILDSSDSNSFKKHILWKSGTFPHWLGVIEKWLNAKRILKELDTIYANASYQCIHLMDNMGFVNRLLAQKSHRPVSVSAMSFQAKNPWWLYKAYLRFSYKCEKLLVIPYSQSFAKKLLELDIDSSRIYRIPWGVSIPSNSISHSFEKQKAREKLGLNKNYTIVLWAGYIQQIGRQDFLFAYNIAKKALAIEVNIIFIFAFKPESFESNFRSLHHPEDNIHVMPTTVDEFKLLLAASDVLFSPVVNRSCIVAPPLTWIETMSIGKPIITTNVMGANEIVTEGETGTLANNNTDILLKLSLITKNFEKMRMSCVAKIERDYNINNIASLYLDIWSKSHEVHSKQGL